MTSAELSLRREGRGMLRGLGALGLDVRAVEKWHRAVNNRRAMLSRRRSAKVRRRLGKWWRVEGHWSARTTRPTAVPVMRFA